MKEEMKIKMLELFRGLLFVLLIIVATLFLYSMMFDAPKRAEEMCLEEGWDGTANLRNPEGNYGKRCYREVPHESGVGTKREYSGEIS